MKSVLAPFKGFNGFSQKTSIQEIRQAYKNDNRELTSSITCRIYKTVIDNGAIHVCFDKSGQAEGVEVFEEYLARGVLVSAQPREFDLPLTSHNNLKRFLESAGIGFELNSGYGVSVPELGLASFHPHFEELMEENGDCQIASVYFGFDRDSF